MVRRILIDPGHGGSDSGALSKAGQREDKTNLNVALYLQNFLQTAGYTVDVTRSRHEQTVTINERMAMVRAKRYDLVISIHHNGGGGDGAEVIVPIKNMSGNYDDKSLIFATLLLAEYKTLGQNLRSSPIIRKANSTGDADYYGVIRAASGRGIPSVITEYAFMDSKDVASVDTYADQKLEAQAIAAAVKKYFA